ncbi:MAG: hypothetical protein K6F69_05370 [Treponema sp.]|nr:hypothetical protein [Treponema sp.]
MRKIVIKTLLIFSTLAAISCKSVNNLEKTIEPHSLAELEASARKGNTMALVDLGLLYEHENVPGHEYSFEDFPLDYDKAASYFEKASEKGNMKAPRHLGLIYKNGLGSYEQNYEKAVELFKLAMERGDSTGTLLYADMLYDGLGIEKNQSEAIKLYQKLVDEKAHDEEKAALRINGIREISTIAECFGDGQKVSSIVIEYADSIDKASVSKETYSVENRSIESVFVNNKAEKTVENLYSSGKFVIINLKYENKWDLTNGKMPERPKEENNNSGPVFDDEGQAVDLSVSLTQVKDIKTSEGKIIKALDKALVSTSSKELVIEDFEKKYFTDEETKITLPYFVYLPENYSKDKLYPLVFFVPDASADTAIENATLTQGNGATVWATKEEQAKHSSIVIAVQYPASVVKEHGALTTDENVWTEGLTAVDNLLHFVIKEYAVDTNRIYGTGQSQGCMTNIALSDKYPELFAAQFLVAGQWNVEEMAAMKDKKLWIIVCQGDEKAYPGMTSALDLWEKLGAKTAKGQTMWNPKASADEMKNNVNEMLLKDADIRMNVFEGGSHMYTWTLAYNIEGIRDWLFSQHK